MDGSTGATTKCALWELGAALRAGDVWLDGSRRYANPETDLIPPEQWPAKRAEACRLITSMVRMSCRRRKRKQILDPALLAMRRLGSLIREDEWAARWRLIRPIVPWDDGPTANHP